jgi:hypothetical protein
VSNAIPETVKWQEKVTVENESIWLGIGERSGSWMAFHEKPYFLLEGPDRMFVIDLASRALVFYRAALQQS